MKKTIIAFSTAVIVLAAASCRKENVTETPSSAPMFTATIESGSGTKTTVERVVEDEVAHYKTKWETDEQINVNGAVYKAIPKEEDPTKADFEHVSGTTPSSPYKAYFPAAMYDGATSTLPASYTYAEGKYNMPMYAESGTTTLEFKNLCGVLAIAVSSTEMSNVDSITVTSDQRMNGAFTATAEGVLTFSTVASTDADRKVTLTFTSTKTISEKDTFYIPVPAGTHNPLTINVYDGTSMKTMVTKKSEGVEVKRNWVYPITFKDAVFSVSATTKVRFSKGNLRYIVASGTWDFYEHQYDFCNTTTYPGHHSDTISLFTWGYGDWSITPDTETYETGSTMIDWGTKIDDKGTWRTLTKDEWDYLLSTRKLTVEGQEKASYGVGNVNGVNGLIILPDSWNGDVCSGFEYGTSNWSNTFSDSTTPTWSAMESAGCVFLPAAGNRNGSDVGYVCGRGYYWSSTANNTDNAYRLNFRSGSVNPTAHSSRYYGCSVRLVSVAQ